MKRFLFEKLPAWVLFGIFLGLVLHAPITVWVSSHWSDYALPVKAWKELALALVLILIMIDVTIRKQWRYWLTNRLICLMLGFALWHGVVAILVPTSGLALISGLLIDLRFVALFIAVYIFVHNYPQYKQWFLRALMVGAMIVIGFAAMQLVLPRDILTPLGYGSATILPYQTVDSNDDYIRINSTLRGPNPLGAYASVVLAVVVAYAVSQWDKLSLRQRQLVLCGSVLVILALAHSYSRSALIAAVTSISVIAAFYMWHRQRKPKKSVLLAVAITSILLGVSLMYSLGDNVVRNVLLHDDPLHGPAQTSDSDRLRSFGIGIDSVLRQPLGAGVGSTGSASLLSGQGLVIENQHLFVAHEVGWIGLILFIAFTTNVLVKLWHCRSSWLAVASFAGGIGLTVIGLFLPVFVDDTVSMLWWGLAALAITEDEL